MSEQKYLFDLDEPATPRCSQCGGDRCVELATAAGRFRCESCGWLNVVANGTAKPMVDPWQKPKAKR
ncbi:MAG: hypothetical protein U0941_10605 [Planctomycetaceae bacterium]